MWLQARGLGVNAPPNWDVHIVLGVHDRPPTDHDETRFRLAISATGWGFFLRHAGSQSCIRVGDVPLVNGRDDFGLVREVPPLRDIGLLVQAIEDRHELRFRRPTATILTSLPSEATAHTLIRIWVAAAL